MHTGLPVRTALAERNPLARVVDFDQHPAHTLRAGEGFSLADVDPDATPGYSGNKDDGKLLLAGMDDELSRLQEKLFA